MTTVTHAQFPVTTFDRQWQHVIYGWTHISPALNEVGIIFARYAPEIWALIFIIMWLWPPWRQDNRRRAVVYATVAGIFALAVSMTLSHVLPYRPRPFVLEPHVVHKLIPHPPDTSFPSDHAAGSFAFAVGMFYASRSAGWWSVLLALVVSVARVFVGVHWPTDVLAGDLIGLITGAITMAARRYLEGLVQILFRIFRFTPERRYGRRA